jgi:hypothetical protein
MSAFASRRGTRPHTVTRLRRITAALAAALVAAAAAVFLDRARASRRAAATG